MLRLKSTLRFALPLALLLATTAVSTVLVPTSAKAWENTWTSGDGSVKLWYQVGSDGQTKFAVTIEKDGKFGVYLEPGVIDAVFDKMGGSNPDPNDPNNGAGTFKPDVEELLRKVKDASAVFHNEILDSPLGAYLERGGDGKGPKWNPGPDGDDSGPNNPPSSKEPKGGLTAEQQKNLDKMANAAMRHAKAIKGGMYDGSEGGTEGPPTLDMKGSPKNNNSTGGNDKDGDGKNDYEPTIPGNDLGPKPELVNPPVLNDAKKQTAKRGTSARKQVVVASERNGKTAKTSNLMSRGLLDGSGGFNSTGPAGTGAVGGAGAMTAPVAARLR
ncbi:MAG: hypothetical protein FJX62_07910 [Alphaproteobacteria bacterium]|nr:hypothetical protein [Alphaproteobacteria bacterium]